jgi:hypothetical protein
VWLPDEEEGFEDGSDGEREEVEGEHGSDAIFCDNTVGFLPPLFVSAKGLITIEGGFVFISEEGEAELWFCVKSFSV